MKKVKKNLMLFIVTISVISAHSQTLTNLNSGSAPGDVYAMRPADTTGIVPGAAGTNVIWDFSKLVIDTIINSQTGVNPSVTAYADSFPDATVAFVTYNIIQYYKSTPTEYTALGFVVTNYVVKYSDPFTVFKYPVSYGTTFNDSFALEANNLINKGNRTVNADGKGTLILAGKTFNNVLRTKTIQHTTDSTNSGLTVTDLSGYTWYDCIHKTPLLGIANISKTTKAGTTYEKQVNVSNDILTSIEHKSVKNEVLIYPNPAIEKFNIDCAIRQDLTMQVYNTVGQCVLKRELNTQTNEIDISSLTKGIYILKLTSTNGTIEKKIIKE